MKRILAVMLAVMMLLMAGCADVQEPDEEVVVDVLADWVKPESDGAKRSVGYFTSWSVYARGINFSDVDPELLTHINYAFANLNPDGTIVLGDSYADTEITFPDAWGGAETEPGLFGQMKYLKTLNPKLKTLLSVGGWTWSTNFSDVAADEASRKQFAASAVEFCTKYDFDGIDIDWEYPVEGGNDIKHRPEDKENYLELIKEVRRAFIKQQQIDGKYYLITIAALADKSFTETTELPEMLKYLDFINLMTYDFHGAWDDYTGHNAPLYSSDETGHEKSDVSIDSAVKAFIDAGVDPADMNLGLGFYGRGWINVESTDNNGLNQNASVSKKTGYGFGTWEANVYDYCDLAENYIGQNGFECYFDDTAKVPYIFDGSTFISYDDEESITIKLDYAEKMGIGGTMFWEFHGDKEKVLQQLIADYYGI